MNRIYQRAILKITGEALGKQGFDRAALGALAEELKAAVELGTELVLILGGGNLFRGRDLTAFPRVKADYLGMTATILNGLALEQFLILKGLPCKVLSTLPINRVVDEYTCEKGREYLKAGKILIVAGGTGNPFFTTDSAAALRALELEADVILKGTKVKGVYSDDPNKNAEAQFYPELTYDQFIDKKLDVMDLSAVLFCQKGGIPIIVFNFMAGGNLKQVLSGKPIGTIIRG